MSVKDPSLMAHALGALDPGDALGVEETLKEDASSRFRLSGLGLLADVSPGAHADVSLAVEAASLLDDSDEPPRTGDRTSLRLKPPIPPGEIHPVLWRESMGGRDLLYPVPGGSWTALDRFKRSGEDVILDVVLGGPVGEHRYTLLLLPADLFPQPWPPLDPRWQRLWDAWGRGDVPGAQVDIEVKP